MIGLQPALTTIQNKSSNQQYPEPNMQTEDDLNSIKNDDSGSVYPIHLRGSRLANPSSATHQPWKRTYVISSSKTTNEHKTHSQISSGGRIALILALAVAIAFTALVAVFLVFRKRYGPGYTIRNFIRGLRPERDRSRETKASSVPVFMDTGLPRTDALPQRRGTKLKKPKRQRTGRSPTTTNSCMMAGAVFSPDQTQSQGQTQPIQEPTPARYSRPLPTVPTDSNHLSIPSVTTWSSYLYLYPNTPPPQQRQQEHDNYNHNPNSNKAIVTTSRRKQPPSPLCSMSPDTRIATDNHLRVLTPTSPCSNRSHFTTTTQSSGPLPSSYPMGIGRDPSRTSTTTASGYGDCRWSYCRNYYNNNHATHSVIGSEDHVVSLPSPSPMLGNIIRPPGASAPPAYSHVYQMMRQSSNGEQQTQSQRQSQCWEMDSYHRQQEDEGPRPSRYGMTGHVDDNGLPILPRSVFAPDSIQHRQYS